jgi:hypothetical protein
MCRWQVVAQISWHVGQLPLFRQEAVGKLVPQGATVGYNVLSQQNTPGAKKQVMVLYSYKMLMPVNADGMDDVW